MTNLGIKHVPAAEEETAIMGQIRYSENTDELLGFCGVSGADHKCLDYFTVVVGDVYNTIDNASNEYKIAPFARAIILNPLHPKLPQIPILTISTCNSFNHIFVFRQWQTVERLYKQELQDIVSPLIGHSSDGDLVLFFLAGRLRWRMGISSEMHVIRTINITTRSFLIHLTMLLVY